MLPYEIQKTLSLSRHPDSLTLIINLSTPVLRCLLSLRGRDCVVDVSVGGEHPVFSCSLCF